ncbi:MAG TPA: DUF2939 domain-containing protein [Caulobacteraceae bacterium]|nr:DUF2939 domain-containing protein [Caulobacteraceae bacterium]
MRRVLALGAVLSASTLCACATVQQYEAASDIRSFLIAIRDGDQAAFDAHIDRQALKIQLRARLIAYVMARKDAGAVAALGAAMAGALVDFAVDHLAQPQVFLAVAEADGYSPDQPIPNAVLLAPLIKPIDPERACVTQKAGGPCVLVFRREDGAWKLIAFEGDPKMLKLGL